MRGSLTLAVPVETNTPAGLAIFQNEKNHYFLGVRHDGDGSQIFLECIWAGNHELISSTHVQNPTKMKFRVTGRDTKCSFDYAADNDDWKTLVADADATMLTTDAVGGFGEARV